ncbi:sel1 repeat family protein [Gemmiger formicilis]|uniref:tetratricopeptide repeat protein n=1 Tax=Gemmiger formicilis TaxID=745368 RepID=UPI00195E1C26|nr:tetratricopeptide repeat protein [Gemmiger formicilis]MBM6715795.1 sel1 repeat family protein [Gemmiger formicilis]
MKQSDVTYICQLVRNKQYEEAVICCSRYKRTAFTQKMLALAYGGLQMVPEKNQAYEWVRKCYEAHAEDGTGKIYRLLGDLYGNQETPFYSPAKQFSCYEKARDSGDEQAIWKLAWCYACGRGCLPDGKKAFAEIQVEVAQNPELEIYLGIFYDYGIGVRRDHKRAVAIYTKFLDSEQQRIQKLAQFHLGICYYHGAGVRKSLEKAASFFKKCSDTFPVADLYKKIIETENSEAACGVGIIYSTGDDEEGIPQDFARACEMWEKAYQMSRDPEYAVLMGQVYLKGTGKRQDFAKARQWFQQADTEAARLFLGIMAYYGCGKAKNLHKAVKIFRAALWQENDVARFFLALCYLRGEGVSRNRQEAYKLLTNAQGDEKDSFFTRVCCGVAALMILERPELYSQKVQALQTLKRLGNFEVVWEADREYIERTKASPEVIRTIINLLLDGIRGTFMPGPFYKAYGSLHNFSDFQKVCIRGLSLRSIKDLHSLHKYAEQETTADKEQREQTLLQKQILQGTQILQGQLQQGLQTLTRVEKKVDAIPDQIVKRLAEEMQNHVEALNRELPGLPPQQQEEKISLFVQRQSDRVYSELEQQADLCVQRERLHLRELFGKHWDKLEKSSQNGLVSTAVLWSRLECIQEKEFDFRGVCITAVSALEQELGKHLFFGFQYRLKEQEKVAYEVWPKVLRFENKNGSWEPNRRFTLGMLPYLFQADDGEEKRSWLREYLASIVAECYQEDPLQPFVGKKEGERSLLERCEEVRKRYRNPSAHSGNISKKKAQECYIEVIGRREALQDQKEITGLLLQFMKILR